MAKIGMSRGPYIKTGTAGLNVMKTIARQLKSGSKPKTPKIKMPKIKKY